MKKLLLIICLLLQSTQVLADALDHRKLRETVIAFVQRQTDALPGKTNYQVDEIDRRLILPQCENLEAFLPTGSTFLGRTSVGVRCSDKHGWSIFVPVQIIVSLDLLVSVRPLPAGHILQAADLSARSTLITQTGGITDPNQITGKVLRYSISGGQELREDMLREPFSVRQGQNVELVVQGRSFNIRSAGVALNNASESQLVKVRSQTGGVVSGLALANGVVEISP